MRDRNGGSFRAGLQESGKSRNHRMSPRVPTTPAKKRCTLSEYVYIYTSSPKISLAEVVCEPSRHRFAFSRCHFIKHAALRLSASSLSSAICYPNASVISHHVGRSGCTCWGHADRDGSRHRGDVVQVYPFRSCEGGAGAGTEVSVQRMGFCGHRSAHEGAVLMACVPFCLWLWSAQH